MNIYMNDMKIAAIVVCANELVLELGLCVGSNWMYWDGTVIVFRCIHAVDLGHMHLELAYLMLR